MKVKSQSTKNIFNDLSSSDTIWKMAATMDGRYILTGSSDKKIKILGIKTKQVLFVLDNLHISNNGCR